MLLPLTLGLVIASAILLVLGFVQSTLGFIYLAMLCAGVAALALFVFARLAKRRADSLAAAGINGRVGAFDPADRIRTYESAAPVAAAPTLTEVPPLEEGERQYAEGEWFFPIEDYDDLRVPEILPLIPLLEPDELEEVREHEVATKNRKTILARLDERLGRAPVAAPAPKKPAAKNAPAKKPTTLEETAAARKTAPQPKAGAAKRTSAAGKRPVTPSD